jgi:hypothetical protein
LRRVPDSCGSAVGGWLPARREDRGLRSLEVGGRKTRGRMSEIRSQKAKDRGKGTKGDGRGPLARKAYAPEGRPL